MPSITAATPGNIIIGAGDIYRDGSAGGATLDDNVFRVEQDRFTPELNGTKWDLKGTTNITRERAFLEYTSAETNAEVYPILIPESFAETTGDVTTITSDDTRRVSTSSYHDFRLSVPGLDGLVVDLYVNDALQTENAEFTAGDDSVLAPRVVAQAYGDASTPTVAPWSAVYTAAGS